MEELQTVITVDHFRAAFLISRGGKLKEAREEGGETLYVIRGQQLAKYDLMYRTGTAFVDLLILKLAFMELCKKSGNHEQLLKIRDDFLIEDT